MPIASQRLFGKRAFCGAGRDSVGINAQNVGVLNQPDACMADFRQNTDRRVTRCVRSHLGCNGVGLTRAGYATADALAQTLRCRIDSGGFAGPVAVSMLVLALLMAGCTPVQRQGPGAGNGPDAARKMPIKDPVAATILGTPSAQQAKLPDDVPINRHKLAPLVERSTPPTLAYARPMHYVLAAQPQSAPLMVLIAGTGAGANSAKCKTLLRALYEVGYSVACLPSPTSVSFILGAAEHPVPGRMSSDVASLSRLLRRVRADAARHTTITSLSVGGYSLGATEAAFLARRASQRGTFEFEHVLLINPAVSVWDSVQRMDRLLADNIPGGIEGTPAFIARALGKLKTAYGHGKPLSFSTEALYRMYRSGRASQRELAGGVGLVFRLALANMAYAADTLTNLGVVVPQSARMGRYQRRGAAMHRAFELSFGQYVHKLLLPYWNRGQRHLTFEQLKRENSLRSIAGFLQRDKRIRAMTNADDIILSKGDVAFLRRTFGTRLKIRPHGGHMGNLSSRQTIRDIQQAVAP